jgi:lysophospholipase L1-like esterase
MSPVILCFGDSNTHGTKPMQDMAGSGRFDRETRWPCVVQREFGAAVTVIEEGHPGRTTVHDDAVEGVHKNGSAALPILLESHQPIDFVVIMLGTNDLKARFCVTAWEIALGITSLVRQVQISGFGPGGAAPKVLLVAPPPILEQGFAAEVFAGGAAKSAQFAARFAEVAVQTNCHFFDAGRVVTTDPLDGIHLNAGSHRTLGMAIAEQLRVLIGQ